MWQREMVFELKEAQPCDRRAIVDSYRDRYGYSYEHMMRIARKHGFDSGRKTRSDKGASVITRDQLDTVGSVMRATRRENKGIICPVENALVFCEDNGLIAPGMISVPTLQRKLRERQMNARQQNAPTPHTEMRSLHPNHVHCADVSTCIQYYLDKGGISVMREDEFYKNKLENFRKIKTPLQRYIMTDHFSGFFFVKYYLADGETAENLFDFVCSAWEIKQDNRFPFRGAPLLLLADGGTRAKAKALGLSFWDGIGVDILTGTPGNSRRQGSVEVTHCIWEEWFETRLRIDPATSLEDLNRKAFGFCLWYNATKKHTRHGFTRLSMWLNIRGDQLRELPSRAELQDLLNKPEEERTVVNNRISFQGKEFNLRGFGIPAGAKVTVIKNLYKWRVGIVIIGFENNRYEAREIERLPDELGGFSANSAIIGQEYKAQRETETQKAAKRMDEIAYGNKEPNRRKETPFYGLNAFEGFADKCDNLATLPKRGTPIEINRPAAPVEYPIMELFKRLRDAGITITAAMNREFRAEFKGTVTAHDIETVIGRFSGRSDEQQRLAAGD
ncbi:MAG: hypothetical protein VB050_03425 [Geobacteraceae bacterium]|nr:hypothetical protein [Geobacteraceae bacterium]